MSRANVKHLVSEYWIYIAVPLALLLLAFAVLALVADDPAAPFEY